MDRALLEFVVSDQRSDLGKRPKGYPRDALPQIALLAQHKSNVVVTGHRRCGKSTFLSQALEKFHKNKFYYLRFADERLTDFAAKDFQALHEIFIAKFGEQKIFFFDEIQGKKGWNLFVNRMYENGYKFYITGSNSELLSKEISTFLTGRHLDMTIYPFSFAEYLGFKGISANAGNTLEKAKIMPALDDYLKTGGFPEVVVYGNTDVLEQIYEDVVTKDIIARYKIKEQKAFRDMALYIIANSGKEFTYNSLKKHFGLGSPNTAKNFVYYLTTAYLAIELSRFSHSLKQQAALPKKIYCIDTGMANKMSLTFQHEKGRQMENAVLTELLRKNRKAYYWKDENQKETDFIITEKNTPVEAIQVCYDPSDEKTLSRETQALASAMKKFKLQKGTIITNNTEKNATIERKKIEFTPLWKWLLEN